MVTTLLLRLCGRREDDPDTYYILYRIFEHLKNIGLFAASCAFGVTVGLLVQYFYVIPKG